MSLMLSFKKAYTKVFSGEEGVKKFLAAAGTVLAVPIGASIQFGVPDHSADRTARGDQQYVKLAADIDAIAMKTNRLHQAAADVKDLTQVLVLDPENTELKEKLKRQQAFQTSYRQAMDAEVTAFRNRLLLAEGISEKDALQLVEIAQKKTNYSLFPGDISFRNRVRYLDECQGEASHKALQPGVEKSQPELVMQCQIDKFRETVDNVITSSIVGAPATAAALTFMSLLGGRFRRQIPRDEQRAQETAEARRREEKNGDKPRTATLKITYRK